MTRAVLRLLIPSALFLAVTTGTTPALARAPLPPLPSPWEITFGPEAVARQLPIGSFSVVVVPGTYGSDGRAFGALFRALERCGKARKVVDGSASGVLVGLRDEEVVRLLGSIRFDLAVVLRLVPATAGAGEAALVTVLAPSGAVVRRFVARAEEPLPEAVVEPPLPPELLQGQPPVPSPDRPIPELLDEAENLYAERRITFGAPHIDAGRAAASLKPHLGLQDKRLPTEDFYRLLWGEELAREYQQLRRARLALIISGGLCAAAFYAATVAGATYGHHDGERYVVFGLVGHFVSAGVATSAASFAMEPRRAGEARAAAEQYNRELRRRLGLPPEPPSLTPPPTPAARSWSVAPVLMPSGGGVALGAVF